MKVVIVAGGRGRRLSEKTATRPKTMVRVGDRPLLWHILKHFRHFGFEEVIVAAGYRANAITEYLSRRPDGLHAEVVDTGLHTATGSRLKRLEGLLGTDTFMMTWGDAVADIDLRELVDFHRRHGKLATVTAVHPPPRFGRLTLRGTEVHSFGEKVPDPNEWINGAFFVLEPAVLDSIAGDGIRWEDEPMQRLVRQGEIMAYRHEGFWQCVDTVHELETVDRLWRSGNPPWRLWQ